MDNFGCKVELKLRWQNDMRQVEYLDITYRNVTEIHYNYPDGLWPSVAFESDIHGTGCTWPIECLISFETRLESEKAESF